MTTRERIAKGIADHDRAIDEARIVALANVREPFRDAMDAFESAKALAKESGRIFSRLAQRREAVRNIGLLDYETTKSRNDHDAGPGGTRLANKLRDAEEDRLEKKFGPAR